MPEKEIIKPKEYSNYAGATSLAFLRGDREIRPRN